MVNIASISQQIWDMKYRLYAPANEAGVREPIDKTIEDTWRRVATALASVEKDPAPNGVAWAERFYAAIDDFKFLPAGRVIAGAGSAREVTLFNCFVMGAIGDDMGSIFAHLREAALTMQQGGGIGYDFSTLRPRGAYVKGVGADASGPLSFMDVWDAMCRTIMSAGYRRGAMMATLRCDHPDIEAFVEAKKEPGRLRMFNLSVLVTDAFMQAVEENASWQLVFNGSVHNTVQARDLWDKIMRATYAYAEPGVIFIDRINRRNPLYYCEDIRSTNPCGEQPLPPYGACLLGSVNLARFVEEPFTANARLDTVRLAAIIPDAVRMMDNIVDISRFPLPEQTHEAQAKRRIGLGITGLADALVMCGLRYGSREAVTATEAWLGLIEREAYLASTALATEKGPFPLFDKDKYLAGETIAALDEEVKAAIAQHGIRNALLTSIAPTGTISIFADNVSSGIEPVFSYRYTRSVLMPDGSRREEEVSDFAYRLFRRLKGESTPLPEYFVDAQSLAPEDHLVMQAAVQRHIDSSISKTINLPADIPFDHFKDIYTRAYAMGCKGCTTYRPNEVTGSVLEARPEQAGSDAQPQQAELPLPAPAPTAKPADIPAYLSGAGDVVYMSQPLSRPEALPGQTYKINWPESEHAMYITINDVVQDGRRRPFEIFINSKNMEHYAWTVALTRMISAVFRRGGDVSFVVEEMKAVFDPRGGAWMEGRYVPSLLAAIGDVIERHMIEIGFLPSKERRQPAHTAQVVNLNPPSPGRLPGPRLRQCPKCGEAALIRSENCDQCTSCDYSKCG
ncbi:MAG TPA: adenosylcobalamin-dependent ribonucleoside-diphosphate reductase [Stellaceae bacterium]|jgi:ribonucleoside-diphosphate reductase alpha chain|nr:adenosylcobalamin-dependent ribonucleoside-diphosphate reductase [Stellaceae bacterium]